MFGDHQPLQHSKSCLLDRWPRLRRVVCKPDGGVRPLQPAPTHWEQSSSKDALDLCPELRVDILLVGHVVLAHGEPLVHWSLRSVLQVRVHAIGLGCLFNVGRLRSHDGRRVNVEPPEDTEVPVERSLVSQLQLGLQELHESVEMRRPVLADSLFVNIHAHNDDTTSLLGVHEHEHRLVEVDGFESELDEQLSEKTLPCSAGRPTAV
eukprot:3921909-Rhodomonas_salina.5